MRMKYQIGKRHGGVFADCEGLLGGRFSFGLSIMQYWPQKERSQTRLQKRTTFVLSL